MLDDTTHKRDIPLRWEQAFDPPDERRCSVEIHDSAKNGKYLSKGIEKARVAHFEGELARYTMGLKILKVFRFKKRDINNSD